MSDMLHAPHPAFPHGGHLRALSAQAGCAPHELLDFSASINPFGPPPWLRDVTSATLSEAVHYPDPDCADLCRAAAEHFGVPSNSFVFGNGSTELLYTLPRILGFSQAIVPCPSYHDYTDACHKAGLRVISPRLRADNAFMLDWKALATHLATPSLVVFGRPNNPTGRMVDEAEILDIAARHPDSHFLVDEAFLDFVDTTTSLVGSRPENVSVLLSLTKMFAIPGLRLGGIATSPDRAQILREALPPWSVNVIAQAVGKHAFADTDFITQSRTKIARLRADLQANLDVLPGLTVYPSSANYLLIQIQSDKMDASALFQRLLQKHRIAIRVCDNVEGLDSTFFRVAVRRHEDNVRLVHAILASIPKPIGKRLPPGPTRRRHTPAIMIQGASSNAGKSVLCAALCRIFLQDGLRVAPFKAQNMSLNSHVDRFAREMGRAQVLQALACRLDPDSRMNPVLLKPSSDTGSQVIVNGIPVGNMRVAQYIAYKPKAFEAAKAAYDSLSSQYGVMVIEGAGCPAEVNLKHHDIVNMAMAEYANARVLLVADIDRGGAYAALAGVMELLTEYERSFVSGYLLNRFRGDASLLSPANDVLLQRTGKPVLGVIPNIDRLDLPEEDSVSWKAGHVCYRDRQSGDYDLDIVVIDLDHISNFTDVDPIAAESDVKLRLVRHADNLGTPDAIIIPGSKNTLSDLDILRRNGLATALTDIASNAKAEIVGICAGMQMLGISLADPGGLESSRVSDPGLALLPVNTVLDPVKTLERTNARHIPSNIEVTGYEIHHGRTEALLDEAVVVMTRVNGKAIGFARHDGLVWGSYLHGLFDDDSFRRWWLDNLRERKGIPALGKTTAPYDVEPALNRLADIVRTHIDINALYQSIGL
ncbi:cobyric acid synthase [Desulfovibrio inopinatus]|uniref:cobyric acid synthase n=1 Tax=Desulfovibrio inopinatus TaxID=102109 RepID=UPI000402C966|nr:cobyric acid synthase [Desulfovibrio inopinatus]